MTALEVFVNRDIVWFSDLMSPEEDDLAKLARNSFDAIRQSSDELKKLWEDLNALMESCQGSAAEVRPYPCQSFPARLRNAREHLIISIGI